MSLSERARWKTIPENYWKPIRTLPLRVLMNAIASSNGLFWKAKHPVFGDLTPLSQQKPHWPNWTAGRAYPRRERCATWFETLWVLQEIGSRRQLMTILTILMAGWDTANEPPHSLRRRTSLLAAKRTRPRWC